MVFGTSGGKECDGMKAAAMIQDIPVLVIVVLLILITVQATHLSLGSLGCDLE